MKQTRREQGGAERNGGEEIHPCSLGPWPRAVSGRYEFSDSQSRGVISAAHSSRQSYSLLTSSAGSISQQDQKMLDMVLVEGDQTGIQRAPLPRAVFEMVLQTGASCSQQVPGSGSGSGRGLKRTLGTGVQAAPGWGSLQRFGNLVSTATGTKPSTVYGGRHH